MNPQLTKAIRDLAAIDSEGQLSDLLTDHSAECRKLELLPDRENQQPAADYQAKVIGRALEQLFGIPATAAEESAREVLRQHPRRDVALDMIADYRCRAPQPTAETPSTGTAPKSARRRAW